MLMMLASGAMRCELGPADAHDAGLLEPCGAEPDRLMLMMLVSWGHVALTRPGWCS